MTYNAARILKRMYSLKLHATRHTWVTFALWAGKSMRWVADQLGHKDPALTLWVYAHAMREEETDLSFAEFGDPGRALCGPFGFRRSRRSG